MNRISRLGRATRHRLLAFLADLCHVQAARAAGEVGRVCAELVFGYNRHPAWDTEGCAACYQAEDLDALYRRLASTHGGAAHTRGMLNQLMRAQA